MRPQMAAPLQPQRELVYIPLSEVGSDETFRIRSSGEVSSLAQSIAQVGQLFPIDIRQSEGVPQAITGFRRLKALRLLHRNRVLVRDHGEISDEQAALIAAADAIDNRALEAEELQEMLERYEAMGWSSPALQELIARAIEKANERLEDLAARLSGEAPPDRSVEDEDALPDDEDGAPISLRAIESQRTMQARVGEETARGGGDGAGSPAAITTPEEGPPQGAASPGPLLVQPPADPPYHLRLGNQEGSSPLAASVFSWEAAHGRGAADEISVQALARSAAEGLAAITQDLATLADHWDEIPDDLQTILADQLTYYRQLSGWLARRSGETS